MRDLVLHCPVCELGGLEVELVRNGGYPRSIPLKPGDRCAGWIYRKYCSGCRLSFSLLPEFLLRRQRYGLSLVAAWLWAWLGGASSRCRDFYMAGGIGFTEPDQMSWADWLDQPGQRTRPGYQLLLRWVRVYSRRARQQLADLVDALEDQGARLNHQPLARDGALALAWRYWEALSRSSSTKPSDLVFDDQATFQNLVRYLAREPSHVVRRASGGILSYDVLVTQGRAQPP